MTCAVARGTVNSTNFAVIIIGGAFTALIAYSFFSETLSPNSPTVLYGDACDRISSSTAISKALPGSLSFHNSPPTTARTRRRERTVENRIMRDAATGRERMTLHFYVQATPKKHRTTLEGDGWLDKAGAWMNLQSEALSEWDLHQGKEWAEHISDRARNTFRFLTGREEDPSTSIPSDTLEATHIKHQEKQEAKGWTGMFSLGGVFKGFTAAKRTNSATGAVDVKTWTEGEVHADLIMVCSRPLFIDNDDG